MLHTDLIFAIISTLLFTYNGLYLSGLQNLDFKPNTGTGKAIQHSRRTEFLSPEIKNPKPHSFCIIIPYPQSCLNVCVYNKFRPVQFLGLEASHTEKECYM